MLRTKWKSAQTLAEELFAIFRSEKLEHSGPAEFTVPPGSQFIIRGGDNAPGSVGPIGDLRLGDIQDQYQFGDGTQFPPFQPFAWPGIDFPQFGQPSFVIDVPVVFTQPIYQVYEPEQIPKPDDPTEPEDPEEPEPPEEPPAEEPPADGTDGGTEGGSGGTPSEANRMNVPAKVVSGAGSAHVADIYADGPDEDPTEEGVDVNIPNLASGESLPVGTWIYVFGRYVESVFEDEAGWHYSAIVPVWLD